MSRLGFAAYSAGRKHQAFGQSSEQRLAFRGLFGRTALDNSIGKQILGIFHGMHFLLSFTGKDGSIRKVFACLQKNPESKQTPDLFCDF